jgi:hypothetical protein
MNNNEDIIEIPSDDYDVNGEYDKNPFIYKMGKVKVKKKNITVHRGEMLMNSEGVNSQQIFVRRLKLISQSSLKSTLHISRSISI